MSSSQKNAIGLIMASVLVVSAFLVDALQILTGWIPAVGTVIDLAFATSVLMVLFFNGTLTGLNGIIIIVVMALELAPGLQLGPWWTPAMFAIVRVSKRGLAGIPGANTVSKFIGRAQKLHLIPKNPLTTKSKKSPPRGIINKSINAVAGVTETAGKAVSRTGGLMKTGGTLTKGAGNTAQVGGIAVGLTGRGTKMAGRGLVGGGELIGMGGAATMRAGAAMSGTVLGAVVGVPMMAVGGVTYLAGKTTQASGYVLQGVGAVAEAGGKFTEKVGQKTTDAGEGLKRAGASVKKIGDEVQAVAKEIPEINPFNVSASALDRREQRRAAAASSRSPAPSQAPEAANTLNLQPAPTLIQAPNTLNLEPRNQPAPENHLDLGKNTSGPIQSGPIQGGTNMPQQAHQTSRMESELGNIVGNFALTPHEQMYKLMAFQKSLFNEYGSLRDLNKMHELEELNFATEQFMHNIKEGRHPVFAPFHTA